MGFFGHLTGKVRCPACSSFARHARDPEQEAELRESTSALIEAVSGPTLPADALMRGLGMSPFAIRDARVFVCRSCAESFDSDTERTWAENAQQSGDEEASAAYRAMCKERERERAELDREGSSDRPQ